MTLPFNGLKNVSRETFEKLNAYQSLLLKWTKSINLIAPSTITDAWQRHIIDSAQLYDLIPADARSLYDLGSGGGLPGIVLAVMAMERQPDLRVILIESDQRKAAFLRTVVRELQLTAEVKSVRIESLTSVECDIVTARALAPLNQLLSFADKMLQSGGTALFQKGRNFTQEITLAQKNWTFDMIPHISQTDPDARIMQIKDIRRAAD